jgi:hypothetical protein
MGKKISPQFKKSARVIPGSGIFVSAPIIHNCSSRKTKIGPFLTIGKLLDCLLIKLIHYRYVNGLINFMGVEKNILYQKFSVVMM